MSGCSYISPANVLRLLLLPKLRFLDISRCYGFSNEFVVEAVERLKEIKVTRSFLMHVGQTEIDHAVLDELRDESSRMLLQLKWEATKDVEHDYDIDEENNKQENLNHKEYFSVDGNENLWKSIWLDILNSFPF